MKNEVIYSPAKYEWARKAIEMLQKEYAKDGNEAWNKVFDITVKGLRVAMNTVFPSDMFEYGELEQMGTLEDDVSTIEETLEEAEPEVKAKLKINRNQAEIVSKALIIYKALLMEYNQEEVKKSLETVIRKLGENANDKEENKR